MKLLKFSWKLYLSANVSLLLLSHWAFIFLLLSRHHITSAYAFFSFVRSHQHLSGNFYPPGYATFESILLPHLSIRFLHGPAIASVPPVLNCAHAVATTFYKSPCFNHITMSVSFLPQKSAFFHVVERLSNTLVGTSASSRNKCIIFRTSKILFSFFPWCFRFLILPNQILAEIRKNSRSMK